MSTATKTILTLAILATLAGIALCLSSTTALFTALSPDFYGPTLLSLGLFTVWVASTLARGHHH